MKPTTYPIEGPWNGQLAIVARPRGNDWLEEEIRDLAKEKFQVVVSLLTDDEANELGLSLEGKLAVKEGLDFISFPIEDYAVPVSDEATFELVIKLAEMLKRRLNIGIHCRAGIGRSSLIVACLLSLTQSVEEAFSQISKSRGARVPDTEVQRNWVQRFAEAHSTFVVVG